MSKDLQEKLWNNVSGNNLIHTSFLIHASTHVQEPAHPWNKCPEMEFSLFRDFSINLAAGYLLSISSFTLPTPPEYTEEGAPSESQRWLEEGCVVKNSTWLREVWAVFFWGLDPSCHEAPKPIPQLEKPPGATTKTWDSQINKEKGGSLRTPPAFNLSQHQGLF